MTILSIRKYLCRREKGVKMYTTKQIGNYDGLANSWGLGQDEQLTLRLPTAEELGLEEKRLKKITVEPQYAQLGKIAAIIGIILLFV